MMPRQGESCRVVRDQILDWVETARPGAPTDWVVRGGAGGAESGLLVDLRRDIKASGRAAPILVAPPRGFSDSAAAALVQIGEQLHEQKLITGQLDRLREKSPWRDKLNLVGHWLNDNAGRLVLICDDPSDWAPTAEDGYSLRHADSVRTLIGQIPNLRRIVGGEGLTSNFRESRLNPAASDAMFSPSTRSEVWGEAADHAGYISEQYPDIRSRAPFEVRLLIALSRLSEAAFSRHLRIRTNASELISALFRQLKTESSLLPPLLRRAALLRRPMRDDLLSLIGMDNLSRLDREILHCLLERRDDAYAMHWSLARFARQDVHLPDTEVEQIHRDVAAYFTDRAGKRSNTLLSDSMEAYHHGVESGTAENLKPFFTDQLNARARRLSQQGEHEAAAKLFQQSINWDKDDDYAHHYYAYNLDYLGKDSPEVDAHYKDALHIDPKNTWWWSRRINFLLTVGRIPEAKEAWDDTRAIFDRRKDQAYYDGLHKWIARLLIELGRLDFAEEILADVPGGIRAAAHFRALEGYLTHMRSAQMQQAVFPLTIPPEEWWLGPKLNPRLNDQNVPLLRWLPARVDECDTETVHLTAAIPPALDQSPTYGGLSMQRKDFEAAWKRGPGEELRAGRYVELAYYSGEDKPIIRSHPDGAWDEKDLPPMNPPDTARYLRRLGLLR